jgi:hypothetical protein
VDFVGDRSAGADLPDVDLRDPEGVPVGVHGAGGVTNLHDVLTGGVQSADLDVRLDIAEQRAQEREELWSPRI